MRVLLHLLAVVLAWQSAMVAIAAPDNAITPQSQSEDKAWKTLQTSRISAGDRLLGERQPEQAIREAFDPLIADYEARYAGSEVTYYSARTSTEGLAYMLGVAAEHDRGGKAKTATVLDHLWAYGYYGKAYALIELGRPDDAMDMLDKALQLSPYNPQFLSERGHIHQIKKEWPEMLRSNLSAQEFTPLASPEDSRDIEHARALRDQGFALIELDRLEEAETLFRDSLKLDPTSEMARNELVYIRKLKSKSPQNKKK